MSKDNEIECPCCKSGVLKPWSPFIEFNKMQCSECDYDRGVTDEECVQFGLVSAYKRERIKQSEPQKSIVVSGTYVVELGLTAEREKEFQDVLDGVNLSLDAYLIVSFRNSPNFFSILQAALRVANRGNVAFGNHGIPVCGSSHA